MKSLISSAILILIVGYFGYVFITPEPCDRVERSTIFLVGLQKLTIGVAQPWVESETVHKLELFGIKSRLTMAVFVQHQFYNNTKLVCPWNKYE